MKDILDLHSHTLVSGHAYSTMREMTAAAVKQGLELFGITDHGPAMPGACDELYFRNFKVVDRRAYGVELLLGAELNIVDFSGSVDLSEQTLKKLDYAIASLHDQCLISGTAEQNTAAILQAIRNPYVKIIGHPDDGHFPLDYEPIVKAAKESRVLLEINNSSLRPGAHRTNVRENLTRLLALCRRYELALIVGSDAHIDLDVGNHQWAHAFLREMDFPEALIVNTSAEKCKAYLQGA